MKKMISLTSLFLILSSSAFAQIPQELQKLIPAGRNDVRLDGKTSDKVKCTIDISSSSFGFAANVAVLDEKGGVDSRRFANFQIGLGHELTSLKKESSMLIAVSAHQKSTQYGSETRSTFKLNSDGNSIKSLQIIDESKGLLGGFKTETNETCFIK
jgi:hypothetical protein